MGKQRRLLDEYRFPGYRPRAEIRGVFGDPRARVIPLERTGKKRYAVVAERSIGVITTRRYVGYGICPVGTLGSIWR
ncbi:MAG: hypothetical protein FJ123_10375 [Deltaproteobacteria bacterium]|nr:hypothetical protein [Deltaproteobacteria bacterium]